MKPMVGNIVTKIKGDTEFINAGAKVLLLRRTTELERAGMARPYDWFAKDLSQDRNCDGRWFIRDSDLVE